jgi:hypothetical protein
MTTKKPLKNLKIDPNKSNGMKPFAILFVIAMSIALVLTYMKDAVKYTDTDIALNTLEQKFSQGLYEKIQIN